MDQPESDGIRLLSFDGGDIRAVSQLIILDEFMRRVEWDRKSATRILPCDYFHMMAGVGTGGIIVFLLAVLQMGIEEATEEFINIWDTVFVDVSLDQTARSTKLADTIKNLLRGRGMEENREMASRDQDRGCKAFVCVVPEFNLGMCEKFRTYKSIQTSTNPTVVEAVQATCAMPTLFAPVSVESIGYRVAYVTGAYNFNNPAWEAIKEACECFGCSHPVACVLSLGCYPRINNQLPQQTELTVMNLVNVVAPDSEMVDRELSWRIGKLDVYHRLSVNQGLDCGAIFSYNPIGNIVSCTKDFLAHHNTIDKVNQCVEGSERLGRVTLKEIAGLSELRSTTAHGLPSLSAFFVERPGLVKKMSECLFRTGPIIQRRMVLSGLGGIGKTQITISFLLQFLSSTQSIESGLVAKVKSLGTAYSRSSAREALEVLTNPDHEITRDWAIIYDNVDDVDIDIANYLPNCTFGTIIVTSRNPNLGNLAPSAHLRIDVMSKEEASEVLLRSAFDHSHLISQTDQEHAHEIAKKLGYLPVALVQAGYFIKIHECLPDYLQRLRKRRRDILGRPARQQVDKHYHGVYATLNITWPHLSIGAQNFISILGFVNYAGFAIVLPYRAAASGFLVEPFKLIDRPRFFQQTIQLLCSTFRPNQESSEQDVDDLVAELEQYSLVTRNTTFMVATLRIHPLVHSWAHDRLSNEEKEVYRAAAIRLLACGSGHNDEDIYEFILPHINLLLDQPDALHANDRAGLALILEHQGDRNTAIRLWQGIQGTALAFYGQNDLRFGEIDLQIARLYWSSENEEEREIASILEKEVVEFRRRKLGPDHPMTTKAVLQRACGMAHDHCWTRKDAVNALRAVLISWEGQRNDDNWETILQAKEALAMYCSKKESVELCTQVLQARTMRHGAEHQSTLKAVENLGRAYRRCTHKKPEAKDVRLATDTWLRLVAARIKRRGVGHPETMSAMENLAHFYRIQGLHDIAVDYWKKVILSRKEIQGPTHRDTLGTMTRLAKAYEKAHKYAKAEAEWQEILRMTKEGQETGHEGSLEPMRRLAEIYRRSGQLAAGETHHREIVRLLQETQGPTSIATVDAMKELARFYEKIGRYPESEVQWKEIMRILQEAQAQGPTSTATVDGMKELARFYEKIGRYPESEVQWKEVIRLTMDTKGPSHKDTLSAMEGLASVYRTSQQYDKAETLWEEILHLMKEDRSSNHKDTLRVMEYLARTYTESQQYAKSEVQWKEILDLTRTVRGTVEALEELAWAYRRSQKFEEAEKSLHESMRVALKLQATTGEHPSG